MRIVYLFLINILIISCGYPDIDSVPKFEGIKLTKEEAMDFCKLSHTNSIELNKCLNEIDYIE